MSYKMKGWSGYQTSPLKQDNVKDIYHPKWNPGGTKDFEGRDIKAKDLSKKSKDIIKRSTKAFSDTPKQLSNPSKKVVKKVAKKAAGKLALKAIPIVGWGSAIYDVGKLGYHSIKEGSISKGWKKFWE